MIRRRIAEAYARNPDNWQARTLMESVVRAEGDTDTLIDVYAASLDDRGWAHLRIARELDRAGRGAEALGWAERGLEDATRPETELVEYVAAWYAADRPADALRVYLDAVAPLTTQTGNEAYLQIARLLLSARDCHERLGTSSEFEGYLAELRTSQRRKRALLRILDYNGL
jgi:hypothetical protein